MLRARRLERPRARCARSARGYPRPSRWTQQPPHVGVVFGDQHLGRAARARLGAPRRARPARRALSCRSTLRSSSARRSARRSRLDVELACSCSSSASIASIASVARAALAVRPSSTASSLRRIRTLAARQHHVELGAVAQPLARRPHPPAVQRRRAPSPARGRCRCPRACACRGVDLREAVEDPLELVVRESRRRCRRRSSCDRRPRPLAQSLAPRSRPPRSVNFSALPTRFTSTFSSASGSRVDAAAAPRSRRRLERDALALGERPRAVDDLVDQAPELERPPPDRRAARSRSSRDRAGC